MGVRSRWLLACALAQAVAAPLLAMLGLVVSRVAPEGGAGLVILMPILGMVEGALLAAFQLKAVGALQNRRLYFAGTVASFAAIWLAGASLSFLEPGGVPSVGAVLAVGVGTGLGLGALLGLAQRRAHPSLGTSWVVAQMAGWGAGLMASAGISRLIWGELDLAVLALEVLKGLSVGVVVGLVTGPVLRARLMSAPTP